MLKGITDDKMKKIILNDFHLLPTSGHAGMQRMTKNIKKYYFWKGMTNDINKFVKCCDKCQKQKHSKKIKEPMVITTTADTAFEKVFLDVVGPIEADINNFSYILTLQCELTKYVEAYPLKNKETATIAKAFVENFILRYGIPKEIATDRGTEFMSSTVTEICKLLKINKLHSTAYHHQSIGALENSHKVLGSYLRIMCNNKSENWSSWIPYWAFTYNTTVHTETQYTPFELVFGKNCKLPSNLTNQIDPLYNFDSYPLELRYRLQRAQQDAKQNLIRTKVFRKRSYDKSANPVQYIKDDLILIRKETGNKLSEIYEGPFKVIEDLSPNVKVRINRKEAIVHKNRTKPYHVEV